MNQEAGSRAVVYCRVSSDEQADRGYSLPDQQAKGEAHCWRLGLDVLEVITDDFSGRYLERPGLLRVTELAEAGAFDVLVCVRLDRLARVNHLRALYESRMLDMGIRVELVEQRFEETTTGWLQREITGAFAEYDVKRIAENCADGRRGKATAKGVMPVGFAPYGYHQITTAEAEVIADYRGRSGELIVDETEAPLVRRIFAAIAAGEPLRTLAMRLTAEGLRTRGGFVWGRSTIHRMLKNEAYVGRRYYGMREVRESRTSRTAGGNPVALVRFRERAEWVPLPCPAIISEALFVACQEQLRKNKELLRGQVRRVWLLNGVATCGVCVTKDGYAMRCTSHRGNGQAKGRYYFCNSRCNEHVPFCGSGVKGQKLETMAMDALRRAAEPERLALFARGQAEARIHDAGDPTSKLKALESELTTLNAREGAILDHALVAGFSALVVQRKVEEVRRRRAEVTREMAAVQSDLAQLIAPDEAAQRAEVHADRLRDSLADAERDPAKLRELFRLFLDVRIYPDRMPVIRYRMPLFEA